MTACEADALVIIATGVLLVVSVLIVRGAWTWLTWPMED